MKSKLNTVQDLERWRGRQYVRRSMGHRARKISRFKVTGAAFSEIARQACELKDVVNNPALQMALIYEHYFIEDGIREEAFSFFSKWKEQIAQQKEFKIIRKTLKLTNK